MGNIDIIGSAIVEPLRVMLSEFIKILPKVFSTAVVILFGYLLGWLLGNGIKHILQKMKFDDKFKELHLAKPLEKIKISELIGWIIKWYTFIVLCAAGAGIINLYPITTILTQFAEWFPKLMIAMAIGLLGAIVAEFIYKTVNHVSMKESQVLASIVKYFILVVTMILALDQIIDVSVLEQSMLIIIGGISVGIALAIGIAFGLALKDEAAKWVVEIKSSEIKTTNGKKK